MVMRASSSFLPPSSFRGNFAVIECWKTARGRREKLNAMGSICQLRFILSLKRKRRRPAIGILKGFVKLSCKVWREMQASMTSGSSFKVERSLAILVSTPLIRIGQSEIVKLAIPLRIVGKVRFPKTSMITGFSPR